MITLFLLQVAAVDPSSITSILWWAVTGLLGIVGTLTALFYKNLTDNRKEIKEELVKERENNSELSERLEANNVDNIKTLNEFSNFLQALISSNDRMKSDISRDILDSVKDIKTHIDERLRSIKHINTDE